jgi:hypothetical protein
MFTTYLQKDMHMKTRIVAALMISMAMALPAAAQSKISIGPEIGFYKTQDGDGSRGMGGVAMRMKLSDAFGIEGSINYRKDNYDNGYVSVRSWPVMLTALIYPVPVVYGAIGAGWYNSSIDYNIPASSLGSGFTLLGETQQQFGWHFGGGLELPLGTSAKLVGDIRYVYLNYNFNNFPGSDGVSSNFYVMSVGLLFNL